MPRIHALGMADFAEPDPEEWRGARPVCQGCGALMDYDTTGPLCSRCLATARAKETGRRLDAEREAEMMPRHKLLQQLLADEGMEAVRKWLEDHKADHPGHKAWHGIKI